MHFTKRFLGDFVCTTIALMQHVFHVIEVGLELMTALANGLEVVIHGLGRVFLQLARTAHTDFLGDFRSIATSTNSRRRKQARHARTILGIERDHALRVGLALLDALGGFFGRHGNGNGIAVALRHLATVETWKQRHVREQCVDLGEHLAIAVVETTGNGARELDVGQLVATNRHHIALAEQNVACLMDGIGEQKARELVARRLHLGLHRGVALQLGLAHKREERQHELVARRHCRVAVNHGLVRIEAARQVIHNHVVHVVLNMLGSVAVGNNLVVGNEHIGAAAFFLQLDTAFQRAEIVAQMQAARGAVAREHGVFLGVDLEVCGNFVAALRCRFVASFVGHNGPFLFTINENDLSASRALEASRLYLELCYGTTTFPGKNGKGRSTMV